jgi:elongation factor P
LISVNELRKGKVILLDGDLFSVLDYAHHKPGKGKAYVKTKLKNLNKGSIVDKTFNSGDTVEDVFVERKSAQFLYKDENQNYVFMFLDTFEQIEVEDEIVADAKLYMKEDMELELDIYDDAVISIELPNHMALEVTYTEPGLKGDTAGGAKKPAEVETGLRVSVPLFIENGDVIKVDTRTGDYIERL